LNAEPACGLDRQRLAAVRAREGPRGVAGLLGALGARRELAHEPAELDEGVAANLRGASVERLRRLVHVDQHPRALLGGVVVVPAVSRRHADVVLGERGDQRSLGVRARVRIGHRAHEVLAGRVADAGGEDARLVALAADLGAHLDGALGLGDRLKALGVEELDHRLGRGERIGRRAHGPSTQRPYQLPPLPLPHAIPVEKSTSAGLPFPVSDAQKPSAGVAGKVIGSISGLGPVSTSKESPPQPARRKRLVVMIVVVVFIWLVLCAS
jgi:hypothetical protein